MLFFYNMIPFELILKIFTYLPDYRLRKSFYSVAKKERTGILKKFIDGQFSNPLIRKLTIKGEAKMKRDDYSHTFVLIGKYLIYHVFYEYIEILDLTTGEIICRVNEDYHCFCDVNLVRDEESGKINLYVFDNKYTDTGDISSYFHELKINDKKINLDINYCRFCEKYTSKYDEKYYTLICAKNRWKLKVSKESKECYCMDEQQHRFAMFGIHGELMDYFQYF